MRRELQMRTLFSWVNLTVIKRGLLLFWAAWYAVVLTTNTLDVLQAFGILSANFPWVSGNWQWINDTMNPIGVPLWIQGFLFGGVLVWEGLCVVLFSVSVLRSKGRPLSQEKYALWATGVVLALRCVFQVLDEVFLAYDPEAVHRVIFLETIATMLFLQFMPGDS